MPDLMARLKPCPCYKACSVRCDGICQTVCGEGRSVDLVRDAAARRLMLPLDFRFWPPIYCEDFGARVVSETSDSFDPATLANVHDLVQACRGLCAAPDETAKGYWSTICFSWEGLEIEVFQDRYEFYRFQQGHTDIEEFSHAPGAMVSARLVSYLPRGSSLRD